MAETLVLHPKDRRGAFLDVIKSARERVALSMFRCGDFQIMDGLAAARARGVQVDLLLTQRAKGWEKKIREIGVYLESMGARVHRYALPNVKYHAKYLIADGRVALVASLNLTKKCLSETSDFLVVSEEPELAASLQRLFDQDVAAPGSELPAGLSERLIVGPDKARKRFAKLIQSARERLQILDHRVCDPAMVELLNERQAAGVHVEIYGEGCMAPLRSHGKMMLIDGREAAIGSISLSPPSLGKRREVAVTITDAAAVNQLAEFVRAAGSSPARPLSAINTHADDEDEDEADE